MNNRFCTLTVAFAMAIGTVLTGCTQQGEQGGIQRLPIVFPDQGDGPKLWVYGSLQAALPAFDATPWLDRFLYGPNDYGKTLCRNPQGMALAAGRLLICDQGYLNVLAIDLATGKSAFWCDAEHPPCCPVDIALAGDNRVCIADTTLRAVLVYDINGQFLESLVPGDNAANTFRPCAVCSDGQILYVGNVGQRCIDRYQFSERRWLEPLVPSDAKMIAPVGLALTSDGVLLIADAIQGCLWRYDTANKQWLTPIGRRGRGRGELIRPKQVCCTPEGLILVTDAGRQSVQVFNHQGKFVTEIHERINEWFGWTMPMGLLSVKAEELSDVHLPKGQGENSQPSSYVIVSDSLGAESLTLLGVVTKESGTTSDE